MTYDYDSTSLSISVTATKIQNEAKNLIYAVAEYPYREGIQKPLVLLAHSFGGLVLKSVRLLKAMNCAHTDG